MGPRADARMPAGSFASIACRCVRASRPAALFISLRGAISRACSRMRSSASLSPAPSTFRLSSGRAAGTPPVPLIRRAAVAADIGGRVVAGCGMPCPPATSRVFPASRGTAAPGAFGLVAHPRPAACVPRSNRASSSTLASCSSCSATADTAPRAAPLLSGPLKGALPSAAVGPVLVPGRLRAGGVGCDALFADEWSGVWYAAAQSTADGGTRAAGGNAASGAVSADASRAGRRRSSASATAA